MDEEPRVSVVVGEPGERIEGLREAFARHGGVAFVRGDHPDEEHILGDAEFLAHVNVEGPSDYGVFVEPSGAGAFLSCTWLAKVTP